MPITEQCLAQFYCTEEYHKYWLPVLTMTDGAYYLYRNGAAWLIDAIASYQTKKFLSSRKLREFQLWELRVGPNKTAVLTCREDSGRDPVVTQEIPYTDFPIPYIKLYLIERVLLLASEY